MPTPAKKLKIAIVTCYDQTDYIRARNLREGFANAPGVEMIVLKNKQKSILRYPEMALRLLKMRFVTRPDAYVVTFRGYEILMYMCLTLVRKPIIFDEMINFMEYFYVDRSALPGFTRGLMGKFYGWQLRRCRLILADTKEHGEYSAQLSKIDPDKYRTIPIGNDEKAFYPRKPTAQKDFNVFYYGNGMTPLHGLQYVLDAAVLLKDNPRVTFTLVGGHQKAEQACADAVAKGAHITYKPWVAFEALAEMAADASLCLGGPFGKTTQSQFVVTGKAVQFMAMAKPVLIGKNKVSGFFKDQENALVVPPQNAQAIAGTISWAVKHPRELEAIGKAARKVYEARFSQAVINRLVADIAKELA